MGHRLLRVLTLGVVMVLGCGKTNSDTRDVGTGGGQSVGGKHGGIGVGAQPGTANQGQGASASTGSGDPAMLPPDGEIPPPTALHKLDLLLMVDNSLDMLEKQRMLLDAVTWLLGPSGPPLAADDIHIGVITSSLGSHGAAGAKDVCVSVEDNDHAQLLGGLRPGLKTFQNSGFLAWGPDAEPDLDSVLTDLTAMLEKVGEHGCGYEASLEAWYRFLVDPEPPGAVRVPDGQSVAVVQGIDETVLSQRAAFMRPDSVLAVVALTDENDCSIQDEGYGWLIARAMPMYRATSACLANPNDPCCQSCAEVQSKEGCPAITSDSECVNGVLLAAADDDLNLRCWDQKRRFGFDLLYPISRYVDGLSRQTTFERSTIQPVQNPIFWGGKRHPSQVIFTGIVGVPWQDLADEASLTGPGLTYLTASELVQQGRWNVVLGDPTASPPRRPVDPFMFETPVDRSELPLARENPVVGAPIVPATSLNPRANGINGHESVNLGNRSLQFACTYPLATPKVCDQRALEADIGCRCSAEDAVYNHALCQPPGGGPAGTTQYFDSALPGIRHLQLLQGLGDNAVTASICPKVIDSASDDFGYRPAMKSLASRLQRAFNP